MERNYLIVFLTLVVCFMVYSFSIYLKPSAVVSSDKAIQGRLVWQKYNCQSCHQLYGLGGYLGPDLTNVLGVPNKTPDYIHNILQSGIQQMPVFRLSEKEFGELIAFLQATNATGNASPASFKVSSTGMISQYE